MPFGLCWNGEDDLTSEKMCVVVSFLLAIFSLVCYTIEIHSRG